ncbi:MAG: HdeD family acid-resistance protein [Candidatus Nanopelagicales bacterium]
MATVDPMTGVSYDDERAFAAGVAKNWWLLLVLGIVSLIIGIAMIFRPAGSTWVLAILLAIYLLVSGIVSLVRAFGHGLPGGYRALLIIGGAIGIFLGLLMFRFAPEEQVEILGIFVGVWFLFSGTIQLFSTSGMSQGKGWAIFSGIVYILAGIVLLVNPWAVGIFVWIVGIWLLVLGIFEIISSFQVRSLAKKAAA